LLQDNSVNIFSIAVVSTIILTAQPTKGHNKIALAEKLQRGSKYNCQQYHRGNTIGYFIFQFIFLLIYSL